MSRRDPLLPNAAIVARQEYGSRVRSRLFHLSTLLLATLAVLVAFVPFFVQAEPSATTPPPPPATTPPTDVFTNSITP